jgi:hypothetical protein
MVMVILSFTNNDWTATTVKHIQLTKPYLTNSSKGSRAWTMEISVHQLQELDPGRHGGGLSTAGLHRRRMVLLASPPQ